MGESKDNALTNALQWLCSPRGGNNFYGRVLNGCRRVSVPGKGTISVSINRNTGRYNLEYDLEWFEGLPVRLQLFVVMHESCHLILQHIPRALWMYNNLPSGSDLQLNHKLSNCAMDFAVNSGFLKKEMDLMGDAYPGLNPAKHDLPDKLMYEEYLALLIEKAEKVPMFAISLGKSGNQQDAESDDNKDSNKDESDSDGSEEPKNEDDGDGDDGDGDDGDGDANGEGNPEEESDDSGSGPGGGEDESNGDSSPKEGDGNDESDDDHPEFPRHTFNPKDASDVRTEAEVERLISELTKETKEMVKQAYDQTIRRRGTVPNEIRSVVDELLKEPEVPWEEILRNMIRSSIIAKMDESAVIPNYSLLPVMGQGILPYPGLQCDTAVNISVVIDTSGSINDSDFVKFITELNGIVQCTHGVKLHIVMFDSYIQYEHYLTELEVTELRAEMKSGKAQDRHGRGGTDFNPPFQCVKGVDRDEINRTADCAGNWEEHQFQKPDLVVFLTDGCAPVDEESGGPIPVYQPDCPVIWVICGGAHAQVHPAMGQRVVVLSE